MPDRKRNRQPEHDNERLSPKEERALNFGIAQGNAGLTYGPFGRSSVSLLAFLRRSKPERQVSIRIPSVLFNHLTMEAKRLGMATPRLMAAILETHQFKDQDQQLIIKTIRQAASKPKKKTRRSRSRD